MGTGFSKYENNPVNVADNHLKFCSRHAEMDALRECINATYFSSHPLKRATIYVARLDKANQPVLAKPCNRCTLELLENGVTKMVYTIDDSRCGVDKVELVR